MAAGMPVVSTDRVMSMRELIQEGVNGHLVPHGSPVALADRMEAFLREPKRISRMGAAARASLDGYRAPNGAARFVRFLEQVVDSTRTKCGGSPGSDVGLPSRPTWKELTTPATLGARARRDARALTKQAVIRVSSAVAPGLWRPRGSRILVYHLVLREDRRRFDEHLSFLTDHYRVVTVGRLLAEITAGSAGPFAALSFDDAFDELLHDALEIMDLRGVKATFFVPTGFVELADTPDVAGRFSLGSHYYERPLRPMKVDDVRRLHALGHEVGSHGVSHLDLGAVSQTLAAQELGESRKRLLDWLGVAPAGFAYPYGSLKSSVGAPPEWVAAAGYAYAVTLERGAISTETDRMRVPREHAEGSWRAGDLRYFLAR
jgi:peptidoglycan/xylan/chitin deacetylase (PgdA/CDA1 family)